MTRKQPAKIKKVAKTRRIPEEKAGEVMNEPKVPSHMYFSYNTALAPPYQILLDTNFFYFANKHRVDLFKGILDCLCATVDLFVTSCVLGELEKLGPKFKLPLLTARDERITRLKCTHKGIYADNCLIERVTQHRCYIVATCDRELKVKLRKIPGVPILYVGKTRFKVEQLPEGYGIMF